MSRRNGMKILVVVDMQNDFINGSLANEDAQKIVDKVAQKIEERRNQGYEIIFTRDTHGENYLSTMEGKNLPVKHCIMGTDGWEIIKELPVLDALIIDKPTFGYIGLGDAIRELAAEPKNLEEVELIGVCTDICVVSNALLLKAMLPETRICVDEKCCAGISKESHEAAITTMKMCQIDID